MALVEYFLSSLAWSVLGFVWGYFQLSGVKLFDRRR